MKALILSAIYFLALNLGGQLALEYQINGLWLVLSNAPPKWRIQWSSNNLDWTTYLAKEDPSPLQTIELRLNTNALHQFWRLNQIP